MPLSEGVVLAQFATPAPCRHRARGLQRRHRGALRSQIRRATT